MSRPAPAWMSWTMWGLVASFYMVGFFQRVAPAVMVDELMRDFHIGGALLGNLSAAYFYSYTVMQIPSGLLADGIGPRRLGAAAALLAAVGTLTFGLADRMWMAYAGRLLVGAAVGVAFVTCMKLAGHWFAANRFATVTGVALLVGNCGGVLAGVPLSEAVASFGWRTAMVATAACTFAIAVAIWAVVRDDPGERGYESFAHAAVTEDGGLPPLRALRSVAARRETWLLLARRGAVRRSGPGVRRVVGRSLPDPGARVRPQPGRRADIDHADRLGRRRRRPGGGVRPDRTAKASLHGGERRGRMPLGSLSLLGGASPARCSTPCSPPSGSPPGP